MGESHHHLPSIQKLFNANHDIPITSGPTYSHLSETRPPSRAALQGIQASLRPLGPLTSSRITGDLQRSQTFHSPREHSRALSPHLQLPSVSELIEISRIDMCKTSSRSNRDLRRENPPIEKLPRTSTTSPSTTQKRSGYPCDRCGRVFARRADALKHIRVVHDKLKTFCCVVCGKKFARKDYCVVCKTSLFMCKTFL